MIVAGAKGFAFELLQTLYDLNLLENLVFYDDISDGLPDMLFGRFKILKTNIEAASFIETVDPTFSLGTGTPLLRKMFAERFSSLGGEMTTVVSPFATIGAFGTTVGLGTTIQAGVRIDCGVEIKEGCLLNMNATIGHNTILGNFVEICPNATISGNCVVGEYSFVGAGAVLIPGIELAPNTTVGAGAVVTKSQHESGYTLVGNPAKKIQRK